MRKLGKPFFIIIAVLFIAFMVLSDSNVMELLGARSNNVGVINGKEIPYQEFTQFVERARENQKASTGKDIEEEQMDQFREQVWDALVNQTLTDQQTEKFGLFVTDKEITEAILGPNPPDFLKRSFVDSTGVFNREQYNTALSDPRNKEPLIQAEQVVKQQLMQEKLQQFVNGANFVSEMEIKRRFIDQNIKMNAEYVLVDLNSFQDNNITVTPDEMKKYYNDHPEKFKAENSRKIKYVLFPIKPTLKDSDIVRRQLENVVERMKTDTTSFKFYVDTYSETPYSKDSLDIGQLPEALAANINNYSAGSIVGPVTTPNGFGIYKFLGSAEGSTPLVKASHILIQNTADDAAAKTEADRVYGELTGGADFAAAAKKYSKDPGSAVAGGELGWFGKGRMVKEFEDACFSGSIGVVQKPVKTSFGYHIIKVTGKSSKKYAFEKIMQSVKASATTRDEIYQGASDFAFLADKNGFEKEVEAAKLQAQESAAFNEEAYVVPGVGYSKSIVKFAFDKSENTVSTVFKAGTGYVVFKVSEVIKPGVKKYEEVEKEVKALVIKDKKYEKAKNMAELIKKEVNGDFAKAAQLHSQARSGVAQQFSTNGSIPGVGLDYNFAAVAYKAPLNSVVGPVKGARGYYLINVKERTGFDQNAYNTQRNQIREGAINEKKQMLFSQWINKLKETAKIKDNRYQFYGQ
ncbi:MAG: peptidylprolyl isomerase [Ignavibacteriales bacterium]|nr:peptidylprolyl isomerase [Ignavibacteriales bacterium]